MAFKRTDEFERFDVQGNWEDAVAKNLDIINFEKKSYMERLQSALAPANKTAAKITVADMVSDLVQRSGLEEYVQKVHAEIEEEEKIVKKKAASEPSKQIEIKSLIQFPEVQEAIKNYILSNKSYQLPPVLRFVRETIKPKLIEKGQLPQNLINLDIQQDGDLVVFITKNLVNFTSDDELKQLNPRNQNAAQPDPRTENAFEFDSRKSDA